MKWVWYAIFVCGSGLAWGALLSLLLRRMRVRVGVGQDTIRTLVERYWHRDREGELTLAFPDRSPGERVFLERARMAGVGWSYRSYRLGRWLCALAGIYLFAAFSLSGSGTPGVLQLMLGASLAGWMGWLAPTVAIAMLAARRRGQLLSEISKFAHRLSICVTEHTDVRELILRSGRPLRLLRPAIQQLAAQWGNDQREAILAFRDTVGISEIYPLVNAFASISRAKPADVRRLLIEHSRSIDASLEADLTKRIENAPVWISFYIMIPFLVCLLLFVYPWMLTVLEQLAVSFTAG